jgi:hypothetical protein
MNITRKFTIGVLTLSTMLLLSFNASADHDKKRIERGNGQHDIFRDHRDIRHFDRHDYTVWRSGRWYRVRHEGRFGWWWVVGGIWYLYPQPVYPHPDPYTPPVIVEPQSSENEMTVPPAQYWYFCTSLNSYYPYVTSCPEGWKSMPATPPASPSGNTSDKPAK